MKLSIIYYTSTYTESMKKSLKSLTLLDDKDIEIIFIDSKADRNVKQLLSTLNFTNAKIKKCYTFENLGHSYGYNLGLDQCTSKYVIFTGSKNIFSESWKRNVLDAIDKSKNTDMFILSENILSISNKNIDDIILKEMSLKHYIFRKKILIDNEIKFENYHHYHNLFIFNCLLKAKKIDSIKLDCMCEIKLDKYTYNLYDILISSELLYNKLNSLSNIDSGFKEKMLASITSSILYEFLYKIYNSSKGNLEVINSAINNANNCINKIYPGYKSNYFLLENKNKRIAKYLLSFTPNVKYIKSEFEKLK